MFFQRARELAAEEQRLGGRYRPPALRAMASGGDLASEIIQPVTTPVDGAVLPPTNYPPTFRRARAGTLPSNVHLAAQQRFGGSTLTSTAADAILESSQRQIVAPPASGLAPARPGLRHSTSVASSIAGRENSSRLRSESLTLPPGGLANNPFGNSLFSGPWLSSTNGNSNGYPMLEDLRSVTSIDSGVEDYDVHTLDYLGLDDHHRPAATMSELRNQAQAAIAGNLASNPARMRANTVSNPYRSRPSIPSTLMGETEEEGYEYDDQGYAGSHMVNYDQPLDNGYSSYMSKPLTNKTIDHLTTTRARAVSVGTLEDPMRSLQRRAESHSYINDLIQPSSGLVNNLSAGTLLKGDKLRGVHFTNGEVPTNSRAAAYLLAPGAPNRSVSPKSEGPTSQIQTPTRSLWIGNLDSAVTSEQLIRVFAPYGAIESLRLLPEKVGTT